MAILLWQAGWQNKWRETNHSGNCYNSWPKTNGAMGCYSSAIEYAEKLYVVYTSEKRHCGLTIIPISSLIID